MHCDICGDERDGTVVSNQEFKTAVFSKDFNPFSMGLVSPGVRLQWKEATEWGSSNPYGNWLNFVRANKSDWFVCSECGQYLFQYLDRKFQSGFRTYALAEFAKKAGVIVALVLCPGVSLILLWASELFSKRTNWILTAAHVALQTVIFFFVLPRD